MTGTALTNQPLTLRERHLQLVADLTRAQTLPLVIRANVFGEIYCAHLELQGLVIEAIADLDRRLEAGPVFSVGGAA